jgi:TRAP-type C4-dicarboxylate transport system permease small subunit
MTHFLGQKIQSVLLGTAAGCFILGAAVTVLDVILRKVATVNVPAVIELTSFLIGLGALISFPVCYVQRSHVAAKLLSEMRPQTFSRPLGLFGACASLIFALVLFAIMADNTWSKLGSPELSRDLALPMPILLGIVTLILGVSLIAAIIGLRTELRGISNLR